MKINYGIVEKKFKNNSVKGGVKQTIGERGWFTMWGNAFHENKNVR